MSHHIFRKAGVEEKVNLQKDGSNAKPYQVKQVRNIILKYKLRGIKNGEIWPSSYLCIGQVYVNAQLTKAVCCGNGIRSFIIRFF